MSEFKPGDRVVLNATYPYRTEDRVGTVIKKMGRRSDRGKRYTPVVWDGETDCVDYNDKFLSKAAR